MTPIWVVFSFHTNQCPLDVPFRFYSCRVLYSTRINSLACQTSISCRVGRLCQPARYDLIVVPASLASPNGQIHTFICLLWGWTFSAKVYGYIHTGPVQPELAQLSFCQDHLAFLIRFKNCNISSFWCPGFQDLIKYSDHRSFYLW